MLKLVLIFEFCIRMKLSSSNANFRGYLNVKQLLLCRVFLVSGIISRLWTAHCVCCQDILQNPQCTKAAVFTPDKAKGRHSWIEAYATNKFFFWASHWVKWNFDKMLGMFILQNTKMCISLDMAWTSWIIPPSPGSIHETITFANWKAPIPDRQEGSPADECRTSLESSVQSCPG